jgi:phosphodiesterase/alkaline phosphatase D-like protein
VLVLSLAAMRDWLPQAIDPTTIEPAVSSPVQLSLLFVFTIGSLLTVRFEAVGAAVMASAAAALALLAAIQYPPWVAVLVAVGIGTPAFLHWLAWQRQRHVHHLVTLAAATAVLLTAVWWGAARLHTAMTGPTHPESSLAAVPSTPVTWVWAGGTTARSTVVVARLADDDGDAAATLMIGEQPDLGDARVVEPARRDTDTGTVRFSVDGLDPARTYHYVVQVEGQPVSQQAGSVRTFPEGAGSFTVAFGSCSRSGSNGSVFDAIGHTDPIAYLELGDIHYANVRDDDLGAFLAAWDSVLTPPAQSALYRSTSSAYIWDDHDYGGNDADRTAPSRPAAHAAYRGVVPHYPLAPGAESGTGPVHQAFSIGRVRFLLTDARSERDPASEPDGPDKTMLGEAQVRWLTDQLRASRDDGVPLTVWLNATPWIDAAEPGEDTWGGYADERERIATAIGDLGMADRLLMLSGDAHMVALDDGTNSGYAAGGGGGFPVAHGGALDRPGGAKGGPFSDGMFPGSGQFGTLAVDDDGSRIAVTVEGRRYDGSTLVARSFTFPG